jgi:plasmid stability protein
MLPAGVAESARSGLQSLTNEVTAVASMTIRNLDEKLKARLRIQAARHGRSMEDEARDILRSALSAASVRAGLVKSIRRRIEPLGGIELQIESRGSMREPPDLTE